MDSISKQEKKWLLNEKYNGKVTREYEKECVLIDQGMPVAYLIGNVPFLGAHIDLEHKPLIPRAETEFWVNEFVQNNQGKKLEILDLFAGSGCIGIGCLKNIPEASVDFAELDEKNIKQVKKNLDLNSLSGNIYKSDVFENVSDKKYDFILANPPYIARDRLDTVQDSVISNEDDHALFAQDNGLEFVYKLIDEGSKYLQPDGEVWIEFDPWQTDLIDTYLKDKNWSHSYMKDQYGKNRVLILQ